MTILNNPQSTAYGTRLAPEARPRRWIRDKRGSALMVALMLMVALASVAMVKRALPE